jgi:hypothetical protein
MEEIVAFLRSKGAAGGQAADSAEHMKALEAAYTMQGEREVHLSSLELKTSPAEKPYGHPVNPLTTIVAENEKPDSESDEGDEEGLGDNVELF